MLPSVLHSAELVPPRGKAELRARSHAQAAVHPRIQPPYPNCATCYNSAAVCALASGVVFNTMPFKASKKAAPPGRASADRGGKASQDPDPAPLSGRKAVRRAARTAEDTVRAAEVAARARCANGAGWLCSAQPGRASRSMTLSTPKRHLNCVATRVCTLPPVGRRVLPYLSQCLGYAAPCVPVGGTAPIYP
jgi:hypothetical protein